MLCYHDATPGLYLSSCNELQELSVAAANGCSSMIGGGNIDNDDDADDDDHSDDDDDDDRTGSPEVPGTRH